MTPFRGTNRVTSGYRLPDRTDHNGIDITNPYGDWNVREVTGAEVTKIYENSVRGLVLETTTDAGDLQRYQHLESVLVKVGQKVAQGAVIAVSGNSGECYGTARDDNGYMAGRHLHFEVLKGGKTLVNPSAWLGLPNKKGDYPGNDDLDGATPDPEQPITGLVQLITTPLSEGDRKKFEELAEKLGVGVGVYEGGATDIAEAVLTLKVALANSRHTSENIEQGLNELGVV